MTVAEIIIEFERECGKCYGTAAWMSDKKCEACNNTGRVSTELGEKLLEFLEHQGFTKANQNEPPRSNQ